MSTVECVVFDVGNVLIRWDPRYLYRTMGFSDAATAAILAETSLIEVNHRSLDAGSPFGVTIDGLVERHPKHADFLRAFHVGWPEMLGGAIESSFDVLARLKAAKVPVHAITNFNREKFDIARRMFPALDSFDELVVSGDIGLVKPDADIFEYLLARRRLDVSRTVFIDDNVDNITTATGLGFRTIHFAEGRTDLEHELKGLGLLLGPTTGHLSLE